MAEVAALTVRQLAVMLDATDQLFGLEDVDAHRGEEVAGVARNLRRIVLRLLDEVIQSTLARRRSRARLAARTRVKGCAGQGTRNKTYGVTAGIRRIQTAVDSYQGGCGCQSLRSSCG